MPATKTTTAKVLLIKGSVLNSSMVLMNEWPSGIADASIPWKGNKTTILTMMLSTMNARIRFIKEACAKTLFFAIPSFINITFIRFWVAVAPCAITFLVPVLTTFGGLYVQIEF